MAPGNSRRHHALMSRTATLSAIGLLLPQLAWASDFSALIPFYLAFVMLIAGFAAGIEWAVILAVMDRRANAGNGDAEAQNQKQLGCGVGVALWIVNGLVAHVIIVNVWG